METRTAGPQRGRTAGKVGPPAGHSGQDQKQIGAGQRPFSHSNGNVPRQPSKLAMPVRSRSPAPRESLAQQGFSCAHGRRMFVKRGLCVPSGDVRTTAPRPDQPDKLAMPVRSRPPAPPKPLHRKGFGRQRRNGLLKCGPRVPWGPDVPHRHKGPQGGQLARASDLGWGRHLPRRAAACPRERNHQVGSASDRESCWTSDPVSARYATIPTMRPPTPKTTSPSPSPSPLTRRGLANPSAMDAPNGRVIT